VVVLLATAVGPAQLQDDDQARAFVASVADAINSKSPVSPR
jgi:hypothetical protein